MGSKTDVNGWPTAVLNAENRSRVITDGLTGSVYFGGSDTKIYRYDKQ
jgi:hypothetical protein